ncbi:NAD(P)/FAD-dependent oxidoreductase [Pikeienuella sp. HZG-20]|uniref:NAD(P)/FAD-dependent oxidoreductase n=1 Tax=Paludibacillus litoralis TaxID=3133267 RepID=UPI0030EB8B0E
MKQRIVIIGGGQAGAAMAAKLRALGHQGPLTLVCEEPAPPYQRPPLSKKYLLGEMEEARLYLRPAEYYADQKIALLTGLAAARIDRTAREVTLSDGRTLAYDRLALTTGARPRLLPATIGGALGGVYPVRTLGDVDAMAAEFRAGARVLIVGGGYIGLEAAAVAALRGLRVTLIELADRILQRVAAPETSAYFRALHQRHGVAIREGVALERLEGADRVTRAALSTGETLDIDFALVGVGVLPNQELAAAAGLMVGDGIEVDAAGRTSDPAIFAAGDCASFPYGGQRVRLECVQNAIDQAEAAAAAMLGEAVSYAPTPWFWSDQYDVKLQIAGLNRGYERTFLRPGANGAQSVWYYRGDRLIAVDAMNDPRAYMVGKRLIEAGKSPPPEMASDPAVEVKSLLAVAG